MLNLCWKSISEFRGSIQMMKISSSLSCMYSAGLMLKSSSNSSPRWFMKRLAYCGGHLCASSCVYGLEEVMVVKSKIVAQIIHFIITDNELQIRVYSMPLKIFQLHLHGLGCWCTGWQHPGWQVWSLEGVMQCVGCHGMWAA